MDKTKEKPVRFGLLIAGFAFLANPYIDMFDFLPDFIGYLLIYAGISAPARINDRLSMASGKLVTLILLSAGRFLAFILSVSSETTTILTLAFIFGVAEIILALVFFTDFFGGFEYLFQRYGSFTALSGIGNLKFLSVLFFGIKIAANVLPNLVAIAEVEARISISASQTLLDIVALKPYALVLFFFIALICGVWWFSETRKYFSAIGKDPDFLGQINAAIKNETNRENKRSAFLRLRGAFILLSLGWLFLLDIPVSGISIFPDMAATLFIWGSIAVLKKTKKEKTTVGLAAAAALGLQTAYAVCFKLFAFTDVAALGDFPLKNAAILAVVSACTAAVSFLFVSRALDVLAEFLQGPKALSLKKSGNRLLVLYAVYLMLTVSGVVLPVAYPVLLFPRVVMMGFFIVFAIARHHTAFDAYAETIS